MDKARELIEKEIKGCFDFFWNESNASDKDAVGYGLTLDITGKDVCSIASVGFALASYVIGCERGYISFSEGYERAFKTLETIKKIEHVHGFMAHFVIQSTGERWRECEFSTIDTCILLMGAIVASEYFGDKVKEITEELIDRTDFEWLVTERREKPVFRMAYEKNSHRKGFIEAIWNHFAEQLMMYIIYAGKKDCDEYLALKLYNGFERNIGSYKGNNYVYCFNDSLFIHQFSHCFFDFRQYVDRRGFDWFQNSVNATLANRQFCIDQTWSKTYNEHSWGLTATQGRDGYFVLGGAPNGYGSKDCDVRLDGTVSSYGPLSSIVFTPKESIDHLIYINENFPKLFGKYGITDSYNLDYEEPYFSDHYLGIDKGPTIIMLDNYLNGTVWKYFMQSEVAKKAIRVLKFQSRDFEYFKIKK